MHIVHDSTLTKAALSLARNGRRVFPLPPRGKRPTMKAWQKRASADPAAVECWWRMQPQSNIGLVTGSGLVVIDVDPRNGGTVLPEWPDTLGVSTPSGGLHLYYACDEPVRNSAGLIAPGVDVRGDGGFVVAPPSVTASGEYAWIEPDVEIACADASLFASSHPQQRSGHGRSNGRCFVPREHVGEGERNTYLVSLAGWYYANDYTPTEVSYWLALENETVCDPPLTAHEVDQIAASIGRYHGHV